MISVLMLENPDLCILQQIIIKKVGLFYRNYKCKQIFHNPTKR